MKTQSVIEEYHAPFMAGDWIVEPELNLLRRGKLERHVEPKVMRVLVTLASHHGHVVSKDALIAAVWHDAFVSDDVLTRCISILRRITGDDPHAPRFIQTVPKAGYRLVAEVNEIAGIAVHTAGSAGAANDVLQAGFSEEDTAADDRGVPAASTSHGRGRRPFVIGAIAVVVLMLAGIPAWLALSGALGRQSTFLPDSFRLVQFTSYAGEQTQPAFSPTAKSIAYVRLSEDGASRRIFTKEIGSEATAELTTDLDDQFSPAWSPDGRQIAYLASSKEGLGLRIATVGVRGPGQKIFAPHQLSHWDQGALSWSPDGKSLIFPDHSGSQSNSSIYQLDLTTHKARSLTTPPFGWEGDLNPAYSPDGRRIAFTRASETAVRDIYWISLNDGQLHPLTHDHMGIDSLAWSADGKAVVFSSNRGGKYALWKIGLNSRIPERLPVGTEDAFEPAVGPSPGQFAYAQGSAIWSILRVNAQHGEHTATRTLPILSSTQQDSAPSLSPDGRFFAMQSVRSGAQEIWTASIDGSGLHQLTSMGGPLTGSPAWSNDGSRILFDSRPDGHSHIFMIAAAGGKPRQITFGNANDIVPRWSHDDRSVYYRSNRGGRWQLWRIATSGGQPQRVTTGDGIEPQESTDGAWLYYTRGDEDGIWRTPSTGGVEERILDQPRAGYWGYWQLTPRGIVYLDLSNRAAAIYVVDPTQRQKTTFAVLPQTPPRFAGLSVTPAGESLLITNERDAARHITLVAPQ